MIFFKIHQNKQNRSALVKFNGKTIKKQKWDIWKEEDTKIRNRLSITECSGVTVFQPNKTILFRMLHKPYQIRTMSMTMSCFLYYSKSWWQTDLQGLLWACNTDTVSYHFLVQAIADNLPQGFPCLALLPHPSQWAEAWNHACCDLGCRSSSF